MGVGEREVRGTGDSGPLDCRQADLDALTDDTEEAGPRLPSPASRPGRAGRDVAIEVLPRNVARSAE